MLTVGVGNAWGDIDLRGKSSALIIPLANSESSYSAGDWRTIGAPTSSGSATCTITQSAVTYGTISLTSCQDSKALESGGYPLQFTAGSGNVSFVIKSDYGVDVVVRCKSKNSNEMTLNLTGADQQYAGTSWGTKTLSTTNTSATLSLASKSGASKACGITYIKITPKTGSTKTLSSIAITTQPTRRKYVVGETFSSTGAVVTATYSDASTKSVSAIWTPTSALYAGTSKTVTASYTEGGVTRTATTTIDVYSITFAAEDVDGNNLLSSSTVTTPTQSGSTITAAATGNKYTFKQWNITGGTLADGSSNSTTISTVTGAVTATAVYYKPVTIKWYAGGTVFDTWERARGFSLVYPETPPEPDDYGCSGKEFYGWTTEANKDYEHASTPPTMVSSGTTINENVKYYAVFAESSGGGGVTTTWVLTDRTSITPGTYAIMTGDYKAFTGSITSGKGATTASAFSFTAGVATSAPTGTLEITFTAVTGGFTMYNATYGYLYATDNTSGHLAWHNSESSYWYNNASNWQYKAEDALLRSYSNSNFNTYGNNAKGSYAITFAKKTTSGSEPTWSNFATSCGCEEYSFHTGSSADETLKTTNTQTCFENHPSDANQRIISDYVIPSDTKFFVGKLGYFYDSNLNISGTGSQSVIKQFGAANADNGLYLNYTKGYGDGSRPGVGQATGAIGTLYIDVTSTWHNLHLGFDPNGYIFKLGSTYLTMHDATSGLDATRYKETDVVTLSSTNISGQFQVNIAAVAPNASTGVACAYTETKNLTTMGVKSGSGNNWRGSSINAGADTDTKGFFRIDIGEGNATNWNAHWVPCWELKFDYKGGSGSIATTPAYVSVEGDAAARTVTIPNTAPSKDGYRFMGWSDADDNTVEYAAGSTHNITLTANKTVYAIWKQVYTVTYAYAGGSGSCAAGGPYAEGETVTTCGSATKAGSTLTGWRRSDNDATVTPGNTFTMPASNVTLTAVWEDTPYTLTQNVGSHTTKGHAGTTITSGMTSPSGLDLTYSISDNSYALPKTITVSGGGQTWTLGTNYTWELSADKHSATLHIGADLTISADVTVTVTEKARYTVIWDEHGSTTTEYYAADDNTVTEKTEIDDCGEKKFYRWTEDGTFVSDDDTPPDPATFGTISGDKHYYAIYGNRTGGSGFVKVTSITAGSGYYMATGLTSSDYVYTGQNGANTYGACTQNNSTGSSFSGATLLAFPTDAKSLTVAISNGKFSLYDGTSYLGAANSNSLTFNDDPVYEWKLSTNKIQSQTYTSRYIKRNTSNERVCAYETTSGVADMYLYKPNISWTNFSKTCTLYDIEITTPSGGEVTTTPAEGTGVAGEGQTITVNVTPNSCKYLSALKYNDGSDHEISIASTPYTFIMPASDVAVTATFADKTVSSIDPVTSTHRTLMQGTSFEGEQIRVTYNNGETEDLAWNDASLTFSGYNMSTLGEQTVNVAYSGSCGSANTSYSIEITDGIPVTFSDCGITTVRKYEPGDVVPVETTAGEYACSGWEFVGWSESSVAANSTSFTPVRNFNASTARTLYAVYANVGTDWISAFNTSELRGGATYVIVYRGYSYDYALLNTVASTNYLNGQQLATACSTITEPGSPSKDRYVLEVTPTAAMKWQLVPNGDYYSLYNAATNKYLKITTDQHALLTSSCEDKFTIANGYNDSQLSLKSFNASASNYYLYWYNSDKYFEGWTTAQGLFLLTNVETFSSNPPCAPQAAIFHGNGGTVIASGGSPTGGDLTIREATRDAGITTPTAEYEDCAGKSWSFIGWADHEVDVTRIPVLTTELLNDGGGNKAHTITTDGEEFWAVYTNQGEALTKYGTISFSMSDFSKNYLSEEHTVTKVVSGDNYVFGDKKIGHASETGIQFEAGTGELYNKTSLGKINSISFGSFAAGALSNLRVYVGNSEKATTYELTAAELQVVGGVSTYYPTHDCEYVYIKSGGTYACVTSISIDFGKGTKVWATTPDCKRVTLSGDIYATATQDRSIMAVTPLHVNAFQLDASAGIVIFSNSSDVYFSTDRNANFAKAAVNQPKSTVTVNADAAGNLSTDVYVHYKPGSAGDGVPADVNVYANLETPDPGVSATHPIHMRNMPAKFVIAAKVGATWYALPADMNAETNPSGVVIEVDETNMTATAPNTCSYTIWPVKTTNGEYDRYAINTAHYDGNAFGERVRFSAINNGNKGLWANNATSGNGIRNYAAITSTSDGGTTENTNPSYEWKITTTVADGKWQYTLQTDQTQNDRYLRYWSAASGGPKWGTYASGEQNLYFLPVTEVEPFEMQVVEWYPTKVLVQTEAALASPSVKIGGEAVASPVLTGKGTHLYEISSLPLESNPTKAMTVSFTADAKNYACTKTVPVIISRGTKTQASDPFATLGTAIYNNADLVVRDGAVLTVDGTIAANTFYDVTIYPTSKISVPSDKKLTVHALTFFGGIDEIYDGSAYAINKYGVPELSLKGTLHKSIAQIDYVMRVDDSQMYSLTVPYDVNLADITYWDGTSMGTLGDKLWVSAYDGDARAKKDMSHTWVYEADFESKFGEAKLKAGVGYTISADLQESDHQYSIIRMPMAINVANDGTENAKTVPVVAHGSGSSVSDNHRGWNLVGNPYMVSISGGDADSKLEVGYLQETGTGPWEWVRDTYRYVTIPADNGQDYWQEKFSSATLKPFKNFFLQIATSGDLSFALASRQDAPARYLEAQKREVEFEINLANGSHEDHIGLLIAEEYSPAYEINADLEKMENAMAVYTLTGGYKLAYNALSPDDASQPVPVGYVANVAGTYTFDLDETSDVSEVEHIWLTDYELSRVVDLIDDVYEFTTSNGRNESRFALSVELKDEQQTPTGINALDADNEKPLKFLYRDKIYILRNGVIYDATGKQVKGGMQ